MVTFIIPIWLLTHCLTLAAHVALIKPTRSHTCVAARLEFAQCQAPQPHIVQAHLIALCFQLVVQLV